MNREIHRHQRSSSGAIRVANVVKSGLKKGNRVQRRTEKTVVRAGERKWIGLSCSVGSPRDPFYIRPRFSSYLVSVVAAVEVPRYRYFGASRYFGSETQTVDRKSDHNRVMWNIVFWKKWFVIGSYNGCLAELLGAKDAVSNPLRLLLSSMAQKDCECWPVSWRSV